MKINSCQSNESPGLTDLRYHHAEGGGGRELLPLQDPKNPGAQGHPVTAEGAAQCSVKECYPQSPTNLNQWFDSQGSHTARESGGPAAVAQWDSKNCSGKCSWLLTLIREEE